jgi:pyruvate dehydrogenase E2 component (dihydrolipoamide acetyltransferase)
MAEFVMPKLGADMSAGTLVAWHKKPGDPVRRGEIVAEVETEKGVIDVEIFATGTIDKLLVEPGAHVPIGTPLAIVIEEGVTEEPRVAPAAPYPSAIERPSVPLPAAVIAVAPAALTGVTPEASRLRISPAARELARKLGVDPTAIQGTGRGGAISREDIERAAAAKTAAQPTPRHVEADRFTRLRQTIAAAMSRSKREIPHYYLSTTIDMHKATTWLAEQNLKRPITERLLPGVLLLKAVALALREVSELNALWTGDRAVPSDKIHIGVAISLRQGGLVAPAIHDTDHLSLDELMQKLKDLVQRTRAGSLRSSELSDPTITVTSMGEQGVESVFGIVYPPQVAIVGFGKIMDRPWVVDGQVVPRPLVTASLSADHRVSDGHRGARFLAAVERLLQEPGSL